MSKTIYVYLGLIVLMASVATGIPFKVLPDAKPLAQLGNVDTVTMAAQDPALLLPAAEAVAEQAVATTIDPTANENSAALALTQILAPAGDEGAARLAKPMVRGGASGLEQTTSQILSDLEILPKTEVSGEDAALVDMSSAALGGLRALRGLGDDQAPATLETLVASALRSGKSDDYINTLVNEAAGAGQISVPSELVTSDGKVDTAVLLSGLISKAKVAKGTADEVAPTNVVAGGQGVEVRIVPKVDGSSDANQFYTVLPGDSLGSISLKFYGDSKFYPAIFNANRSMLSSPDQLNVGQRLVVPDAASL
jgi:nucleoid-associated protein YgaU